MNPFKPLLKSTTRKLSLYDRYKISKELTGGKMLSYSKIQQYIVREPDYFFKKFRYTTKLKLINTLKPLEPLKFKLNNEFKDDYYFKQPEEITKKMNNIDKIYNSKNANNSIPTFKVLRSHNNNLPVYSEYKNKHLIKKTIIKNISGSIEDLVTEIKKITSNSNVVVKTGRLEVNGLHVDKIRFYLARLGF